jgi:protein tyrosine/serine phosphatase
MALAGFLVLGALSIAYAIDRHQTLYHFATVDPGKLYRSGTLSRRGLEKVHALTGFKTIINLRSVAEMNTGRWYPSEEQFALEKGIRLVSIPMFPDVPPSADQIRQFLDIVTDPAGLPALVHCEMGVVRTGMLVAVYKVAVLKEANPRVMDKLPMFGHSLDQHPSMKEFILGYAPSP